MIKRILAKGDLIGPNGVVYLEEAYTKNNKRYVVGLCGECHKNKIIARLDGIDAGSSFRCKECSNKQKREQWSEALKKGQAQARKNNTKYYPGDILKNEILSIKELTPVTDPSGHKRRVGVFKNLNTNITYTSTLRNVLSSISLGLGRQSKGEHKIQTILNEMNVNFYSQYRFDDCVNPKTGAKLRFDFYLPDYNCCIEYDGEQHFSNTFNLPEEDYEVYLENAKRKDSYCKKHNIKIIHIKYTEYEKLDKNYIRNRIVL